jgi:hypothetical protein
MHPCDSFAHHGCQQDRVGEQGAAGAWCRVRLMMHVPGAGPVQGVGVCLTALF